MIFRKIKTRDGFSYMEIIIATALFSIVFAAVLPVISQASRNLAYAQSGYEAHLHAQSLLLTIRDATAIHTEPHTNLEEIARVHSEARGNFPFTVWLIGGAGDTRTFASPHAPTASAQISGISLSGNQTAIVVVVWGEQGRIAARAVGFR
jgi:type II secretory pathway pseudopilin PulG